MEREKERGREREREKDREAGSGTVVLLQEGRLFVTIISLSGRTPSLPILLLLMLFSTGSTSTMVNISRSTRTHVGGNAERFRGVRGDQINISLFLSTPSLYLLFFYKAASIEFFAILPLFLGRKIN